MAHKDRSRGNTRKIVDDNSIQIINLVFVKCFENDSENNVTENAEYEDEHLAGCLCKDITVLIDNIDIQAVGEIFAMMRNA